MGCGVLTLKANYAYIETYILSINWGSCFFFSTLYFFRIGGSMVFFFCHFIYSMEDCAALSTEFGLLLGYKRTQIHHNTNRWLTYISIVGLFLASLLILYAVAYFRRVCMYMYYVRIHIDQYARNFNGLKCKIQWNINWQYDVATDPEYKLNARMNCHNRLALSHIRTRAHAPCTHTFVYWWILLGQW